MVLGWWFCLDALNGDCGWIGGLLQPCVIGGVINTPVVGLLGVFLFYLVVSSQATSTRKDHGKDYEGEVYAKMNNHF